MRGQFYILNDLPRNLVSSKHPRLRKSFVQSPMSNDRRGSLKAGQCVCVLIAAMEDCWF